MSEIFYATSNGYTVDPRDVDGDYRVTRPDGSFVAYLNPTSMDVIAQAELLEHLKDLRLGRTRYRDIVDPVEDGGPISDVLAYQHALDVVRAGDPRVVTLVVESTGQAGWYSEDFLHNSSLLHRLAARWFSEHPIPPTAAPWLQTDVGAVWRFTSTAGRDAVAWMVNTGQWDVITPSHEALRGPDPIEALINAGYDTFADIRTAVRLSSEITE